MLKPLHSAILALSFSFPVGLLAQIALSGTSYIQNFDAIGSGLPTGWSVRTGATAGSLGTPQTFTDAKSVWSAGAGFRNFASAKAPLDSLSNNAAQNGAADRALGLRQTNPFGDPGASMVLHIANTAGFCNLKLSLTLQTVFDRSRTTEYLIQCARDTSSWDTLATYTTGAWTGQTFEDLPFPCDYDNQLGSVWIRIVALSPSFLIPNANPSGRDAIALDDFKLTWDTTCAPLKLFLAGPPSAGCGDTVEICVLADTLPPCVKLASLQFAVRWDTTSFKFVSVMADDLGGYAPSLGGADSTVTYSWIDNDIPPNFGIAIADTLKLMTIKLVAINQSGAIRFDTAFTTEAINAELTEFPVMLGDALTFPVIDEKPEADSLISSSCQGATGPDRARIRVILPGSPTDFEAVWIIGANPAGLTPGTAYGPGDDVPGILTFPTTNRRTARIEPAAPAGVYEFCAKIRNRNTGCESDTLCGFKIIVDTIPVVACPPDDTVCINLPAFALEGATPVGGDYSGIGV
ncbi:MAG: hypothetical protein ACK4NS_10425, partial [Saprospiraceae bacterium]